MKTYVITQNSSESMKDFWTRLANEIRTMNVKIISMDVDVHCGNVHVIILFRYKNE